MMSFFRKLKRSCSWFKFMWSNDDYDSSFLLRAIDKKLKDMEKMFKDPKRSYAMCHYSYGRQIAICRHYLKLMIDEDPCSSLFDKYFNKCGYSLTKKSTPYENKLFKRICRMESYYYKKIQDRFFYIFTKYYRYWCD